MIAEEDLRSRCFNPISKRDEGWAWIVLCSSFFMQMLIDGTVSGYGVIYIGMKNDSSFLKANYTESQLALPGAIQACLFIISCGLSGALVGIFGFQLVACLGGLMAGLSMAFASFFTNIIGVIVFYGFLSGFGLGSVWICALVSVTYYFEKYRGIASGLSASGNGMGYIVVPLVLNVLSEHIGWRHAVVVYSSIVCMVFVLAGSMLRPIVVEQPGVEQIPATGDLKTLTLSEPSRPRCRNRTITFCEGKLLEPIIEIAFLSKVDDEGHVNNSATLSRVNFLQSSEASFGPEPRLIFASTPAINTNASLGDSKKNFRSARNLWSFTPFMGSSKIFEINSTSESLDYVQKSNEDMADKNSNKVLPQTRRQFNYFTSNPDGLSRKCIGSNHFPSNSTIATSQRITLKPLRRPDSFFAASVASLRLHDKTSSQNFTDTRSQMAVLNLIEKLASSQNLNTNHSNEIMVQDTLLSSSNQVLPLLNSESIEPNLKNCLPSDIVIRNSSSEKKGQISICAQCVKIFDLTLFTNYNFLLLSLIFFFCQLSYFVPFMYFFTFALDNGFTRSQTMYLTVIIGILHILGRIVGGLIANIPGISLLSVSAISYFLVTLTHVSLPYLPRTFLYLAIYCGSFGFLCAVSCPLQALMCVQLLGLERLTMSLGNSSLIKAIAAVTGPIIAAYIKDCTGSLDGVFYWCGGCYAVGGLLHFCLYFPCSRKYGK